MWCIVKKAKAVLIMSVARELVSFPIFRYFLQFS